MADIDGLKQRIELIDLRLKTAHSARERESAALMDVWAQIRDRLQDQNTEILALRNRITELEDTKAELQTMVDNLLRAVEGGVDRMSDETLTEIREMASGILTETAPSIAAAPMLAMEREAFSPPVFEGGEPDDDTADAEDDDFLTALERSANGRGNENHDDDSVDSNAPEAGIEAPISPGIRDLIARIEESTGEAAAAASESATAESGRAPESSNGLNEDLMEIEQLRNELLGLRERISGSGR